MNIKVKENNHIISIHLVCKNEFITVMEIHTKQTYPDIYYCGTNKISFGGNIKEIEKNQCIIKWDKIYENSEFFTSIDRSKIVITIINLDKPTKEMKWEFVND